MTGIEGFAVVVPPAPADLQFDARHIIDGGFTTILDA
jgi:uncharacterized protein YbaA (DUF1428 family)